MKKQIDIAIVDAIKSIISVADGEVAYRIDKHFESPNKLDRMVNGSTKREVISVNITLSKTIK